MVNRRAFTLAEVLITLGIIGVVASLTIPTLISKKNDMELVSAARKSYSTLSQAYKMAIVDNGNPSSWPTWDATPTRVIDILAPYLKVAKVCTEANQGCFSSTNPGAHEQAAYLSDNSTIQNESPWPNPANRLLLADGSAIMATHGISSGDRCSESVSVSGTNKMLTKACGTIYVDVNGPKLPNTLGKDILYFYWTEYGIIPRGSADDMHSFDGGCINGSGGLAEGHNCAAWIIENGNFDYIKCPAGGLGWNTKRTCDG